MPNEFLIPFIAIIDLGIILLAFRLGTFFLIGAIVTNLIMVSLTAPKVGMAFGAVVSPQSIFYASIFLGTDILTEFNGKKYGFMAIWTGFLALLLVAFLGKMSIVFQAIPPAQQYADAYETVFGATWRVALGSFIAYAVSQSFDVWFFHWLKEKTKGKRLWLRNNLSTITSQFIDTALFFPIAFAGIMPNLIEVMLVAYLVKIAVAGLDTPFMYFAKWIKKEG